MNHMPMFSGLNSIHVFSRVFCGYLKESHLGSNDLMGPESPKCAKDHDGLLSESEFLCAMVGFA